jgi:hypothetical protein
MAGYATAVAWDQAGRPNFVDSNENTDQNPVSTGCGMVFIDWLFSLGYDFAAITRAASATLGGVYAILVGKTSAWADFTAALSAVQIQDDDPFRSYGGTAPPPPPTSGDLVLALTGTVIGDLVTLTGTATTPAARKEMRASVEKKLLAGKPPTASATDWAAVIAAVLAILHDLFPGTF